MVHRYVPLASIFGALVFSGCVIYTEPTNQPPPPPPPPAKANQGQPGKPGKPATVVYRPGSQPGSQPQPTAQPGPTSIHQKVIGLLKVGDINVVVANGTCAITVDGVSHGTGSTAAVKVGAGSHEVSCQPAGKPAQKQTVAVKNAETTTVTFDLNNPSNNKNVSMPTGLVPPGGRPTPPVGQ
jgi:hypothetical protein